MTFTGLWPLCAIVLLLLCNLDSVTPGGNYEHYKAAVLAHFRVDSQAVDQLVDASRDPVSVYNENAVRHYVQQANHAQRAPIKFAVVSLLMKKAVDVKRSKARIELWKAQQSRNQKLVQYWRQELREYDKSERTLYQLVGYNPEREALYQGRPPRRRHSIHRSVQERSNKVQEPPTVAQLNQMIEAAYSYVLGKSAAYAQALESTGHLHHYSGADFSKLLQSLKAKLEKGQKVYEEMQQVYRTCVNISKLGPDEPMPAQFMPKYVNFHQNVYWNSWLDWFVKLAARQRFNNKMRVKIGNYENEIVEDPKSLLDKLKQEAQSWERSLGQAFGILTSNLKVLTHDQINDLRDFDRKFAKSWVTINGLLNALDKKQEQQQTKVEQDWSANQNGHEGLQSDPNNIFWFQEPPGQDLVLARIQAPTKPNKIPKYFLQKKFFYIPAIVAGMGIPVGLKYDLYNKFLGLIGRNSEEVTIEMSSSSVTTNFVVPIISGTTNFEVPFSSITDSIEMSSNMLYNGASPTIMPHHHFMPSSTNPPSKLSMYLTVSALVILALLIAGYIALTVKRQT